jgi:hypothetical protein
MNENTDSAENPKRSNAFLQLLQVHDKGQMCDALADALRAMVDAVERTGKPASFTLTGKMVPAAKGVHGMVFEPVKLKLPEPEQPTSLWYADKDGNLHRHNPNQDIELPLRMVPAAREEARPTPSAAAAQ